MISNDREKFIAMPFEETARMSRTYRDKIITDGAAFETFAAAGAAFANGQRHSTIPFFSFSLPLDFLISQFKDIN
jgi:hypothetical protein